MFCKFSLEDVSRLVNEVAFSFRQSRFAATARKKRLRGADLRSRPVRPSQESPEHRIFESRADLVYSDSTKEMLPRSNSPEVALSVSRVGISAGKPNRLQRITDWPARAEAAAYSVTRLAADCGLSVRQLQRFFRAHFRQSPKSWLRALRLRRAFDLLGRGCSVKETAFTLHYRDPSHFSKDFIQLFGMHPSTFALRSGTTRSFAE